MKYLIKINEAVTKKDFLLDLQDFCDNHLAYLLDEGTKIIVMDSIKQNNPMMSNFWYERSDKKIKINDNIALIFIRSPYKTMWEDVKDYMIPFFNLLDKEYNIIHDKIGFRLAKNPWQVIKKDFNVEDIISEITSSESWKLVNKYPIIRFEIRVKAR
jgi:hypothetical protein